MIFQDEVDGLAAARWVTSRFRSGVSPSTIAQDISAARMAARSIHPKYAAALDDQILTDVVVAARKLAGPAPLIKGAPPMQKADYDHLLLRGPLECRQVLALAWMRAGRTADTLALRTGSLWREDNPPMLNIELGIEKTRKLGIPGFVTVPLPGREEALLAPLIARHPPTTPPATRPLLFQLKYAAFRQYFLRYRLAGSKATPHSLRKGAVVRMLDAGVSLRDISLVTQHRTTTGLMAYVPKLDAETKLRMTRASAAIAGATCSTSDAGATASSP